MPAPPRFEGYVIVSADGMIADAAGQQPPALRIPADQQFFRAGLDRADAVVHGRYSHEGGAGSRERPRIVLTRAVAGVAPHPRHSHAVLWNPAGAPFDDAARALGVAGTFAVIGGTEVFGLFLEIGYERFHLTRANRAVLPGGRPVFPDVPARSPEDLLSAHRLRPGPTVVLDAAADVTLVTWAREG